MGKLGLFCLSLCNRHLQVRLDRKSVQGYPIDAVVPQSFIVHFTLFMQYINNHSYVLLLVF